MHAPHAALPSEPYPYQAPPGSLYPSTEQHLTFRESISANHGYHFCCYFAGVYIPSSITEGTPQHHVLLCILRCRYDELQTAVVHPSENAEVERRITPLFVPHWLQAVLPNPASFCVTRPAAYLCPPPPLFLAFLG